jgi:hypothetical protein
MDTEEIRKTSHDEVWAMFLKSWELARVNYPLTLTLSFFLVLSCSLSAIPFIGAFISGVALALAPMVFLLAGRQWEQGNASDLKTLMAPLQDQPLRQRMMPLIILQTTTMALPVLIGQVPTLNLLFGWIGLLTLPLSLVLLVAYPILYFQPDVKLEQCLSLAIEGISKNLAAFVVAALILFALLTLSALLFVIPLIAIGLPVLFMFQYLWYRVVYEQLVIEPLEPASR